MRSRVVVVSVTLGVLLVLGMAGIWYRATTGMNTAHPQEAARTSFPDLPAASDEPTLPSLSALHPKPGTVVEAEGPFDDRFHFSELAFDGSTVTGTADITSDVSELLEFEALAGFYDADGTLRGTGRHVYQLDGTHGHAEDEGDGPAQAYSFEIEMPEELRGVAVAAAVGVPVLVNE